MIHHRSTGRCRRQSTMTSIVAIIVIVAVSLLLSTSHDVVQLRIGVSASAIAPPIMAARLKMKTKSRSKVVETSAKATATASSAAATIAESPADVDVSSNNSDDGASQSTTTDEPSSTSSSSNPIVQLANYIKDTALTFKNGLGQMNTDHRRCNDIRTKQRSYAKINGTTRPRGVKGIQTGGITYEEYDFLRKGLVDRNKLFAVVMVTLCLPNYFVYYLWSFPDMMPSPFLKETNVNEICRERNHAVISTLLDIEKGARVAPWTSKLNPFGKRATERSMDRLDNFITWGCQQMEEYSLNGPYGGKQILKKLRPQLYTSTPLTKQQQLLAGNIIPKQIIKGLTKAIGADPINKGSNPFGIGVVKHIESVTLADEFIVNQGIDIDTINDELLAEACSARLIGNPQWTSDERKEALSSWLKETEMKPREIIKQHANGTDPVYYNGNLARAALMCYNAVDGTRDSRSDSRLVRSMYQGQQKEFILS